MPSIREHRTETAPATAKGRRLDLDVVRGLAILLALGWHFSGPSGSWLVDVLQFPGRMFGWAGVDLFFVLSGFLMGRLVLAEHARTGSFDGRRFTVRRVLKLWPVLYVFLVVHALFGSEPLGSYLWQNALHVQNYAGTSLAHLWSLAVEEHFYLALALLFPLLVRRRGGKLELFAGVLVGVLVAALVLRITGGLAGVSETRLQWRTHFRVDSLAAGVLLAVVSVRWPERFAALQQRRRALLAVLAVGVVFLCTVGKQGLVGSTIGFTVAYVTAAAVLLLLYRAAWVSRARWVSAPVAALGRYSYGIYIWHIFAAHTVLGWLGRSPDDASPAALAVKYGSAVLVGIAATVLVERPALRLRDRLVPATPTEKVLTDPALVPERPHRPLHPPVLEAPVLPVRLLAS
ncbi:acyltransferase family protein [Geodermatophilus sp. SYSU D00691]